MWSRRLVLAAVWTVGCIAACSSDDSDDGERSDTSPSQTAGTRGSQTPAPSGSGASGTLSSGSGGNGGSTNPSFGGSGPMSVTPTAGTTGGAPDFSCAKRSEEAKRVPVDMYIMLDRSESMLGVTGTGDTKWDAIRAALAKFVSDPRSNGLSVGLQYFPLGKPGVPEQCTMDSECGMGGGPCVIRVCQPPASSPTFVPQYCGTDADCPDRQPCVLFGLCSRDNSVYCFDFGPGACNSLTTRLGDCLHPISTCDGYATCDPGDYSKPAVPIGELPAQTGMLTASLIDAKPVGLTPTSAALSGALQQAKQRAAAEPMHKVIALLATDGLPTECTPTDAQGIADIAKGGAMGTPPINTYVIGVFSPQETMALMNLDTWAAAGGTEKAFILDPSQDVNAQFLNALEKIRGGTLACDYALPPSPEGNELDLGLVNVAVVSDQATRDLRYVGDSSSCNKTEYGWHYDADPDSGKATKIVACPKTCDMLKMTSGKVELKLGCKTMGPD